MLSFFLCLPQTKFSIIFFLFVFSLFSFFPMNLCSSTSISPPRPFYVNSFLSSCSSVLLFSILICHAKSHSPAILLFSFSFLESVPVFPHPPCFSQLFYVWLQGCPTLGLQGRGVQQLTPGVWALDIRWCCLVVLFGSSKKCGHLTRTWEHICP